MAEHIVANLGSRPLVEVTSADVVALIEQVGTAASADVADQVRATRRGLFADAAEDGLVARSAVPEQPAL